MNCVGERKCVISLKNFSTKANIPKNNNIDKAFLLQYHNNVNVHSIAVKHFNQNPILRGNVSFMFHKNSNNKIRRILLRRFWFFRSKYSLRDLFVVVFVLVMFSRCQMYLLSSFTCCLHVADDQICVFTAWFFAKKEKI